MAEKHSRGESHRLLLAAESVVEGCSVAGWLEREGFDVMTSTDGQEALQIACSSWPPDVVLLDLRLPGVDGISIYKQIRAKNRTAVIFVLGDGSEGDEVRSLEAGADDYLPKHFSPEVLLARARAHLRSRRQPANPTAWRPLAGCEELRNPGKGRVGRTATAGVPPTNSLGAVLRGAREPPRADPAAGATWRGASSRTVDIHISRVRARIEPPSDYTYIHSVRGFGYRFAPLPKEAAMPDLTGQANRSRSSPPGREPRTGSHNKS